MLKKGTYLDTPEKEYRAWPAINYSSLSRFNESQDHALLDWPAKSYFEEGRAFELLIEDRAKGTAKFAERFFLADAPGAMPEDLAGWIDRKESLNDKYVWCKPDKKTGEVRLNMKSEKMHLWLDACRDHPGQMPMGRDQMEMLDTMVDNFLLCQPFADEISRAAGVYSESSLAEILPACDFQVPIVWYVGQSWDGKKQGKPTRKKALIDCLFETTERMYAFDIKTAATIKQFERNLRDGYWIQEAHYTAGLGSIFPKKEIVWRFLVAPKDAPHVAQPFIADQYSMQEYGIERYYDLCTDYQAWVDAGKPPKGWKELESVKIFFD